MLITALLSISVLSLSSCDKKNDDWVAADDDWMISDINKEKGEVAIMVRAVSEFNEDDKSIYVKILENDVDEDQIYTMYLKRGYLCEGDVVFAVITAPFDPSELTFYADRIIEIEV